MESMYISTPIGKIKVTTDADTVIAVDFDQPATQRSTAPTTSLQRKIKQQIDKYFHHQQTQFDLPLQPHGTAYQQRVWRKLTEIPFGQVTTYGELAKILSSSPRAVGNACRANPIPLLIPCHRVVAQQGIGGYAGKTAGKQILTKRKLLAHEGVQR